MKAPVVPVNQRVSIITKYGNVFFDAAAMQLVQIKIGAEKSRKGLHTTVAADSKNSAESRTE